MDSNSNNWYDWVVYLIKYICNIIIFSFIQAMFRGSMKEDKTRRYALIAISLLFIVFYAGIARNMHTLRVYQDNLSVILLHFDIFVQIFTFAVWYKIYNQTTFGNLEKNIYIVCGIITIIGNLILYIANFVVWMGVEPWSIFWLWFAINGLGVLFPVVLFLYFKKKFI